MCGIDESQKWPRAVWEGTPDGVCRGGPDANEGVPQQGDLLVTKCPTGGWVSLSVIKLISLQETGSSWEIELGASSVDRLEGSLAPLTLAKRILQPTYTSDVVEPRRSPCR